MEYGFEHIQVYKHIRPLTKRQELKFVRLCSIARNANDFPENLTRPFRVTRRSIRNSGLWKTRGGYIYMYICICTYIYRTVGKRLPNRIIGRVLRLNDRFRSSLAN